MNYGRQLNRNAESCNFEKSPISKNLKDFFTILFTSWKATNVDSIISSVTIDSMNETELFFKELFINIYELSSKSETNLKADNAISTINTLDTILPEILIEHSEKPEAIIDEYASVKRKAYHECFSRLRASCKLFHDTSSGSMLAEIKNVCVVLTKLSEIKYFDTFVYEFASFLWDMFMIYRDQREICQVLLFSLSSISHQLVRFLLMRIDGANNELSLSLAADIFHSLKCQLIQGHFGMGEIVYVLNILDRHDRFVGQYFDAVPENIFMDGYIICSSQTKSLENDDVYEDYEKFILEEYD